MFHASAAAQETLEQAISSQLAQDGYCVKELNVLRQSLDRILQSAPSCGDPVQDLALRAMLATRFHAALNSAVAAAQES
ncbi:hypothetical protein [Teichococcus vastitatis]|uniref:hypothetical protein n=1 Tax=Teichococcus vastitatis TaxID=2307076 RepID=UPI000E73CB21|nr:hypothetical protein [Pseudoroseomonas vastitatis]